MRINANVTVLFLQETEGIVAYAPALDLSTCGPSFDEAKKNFEEAYAAFVEECVRMGTLEEVLSSLGWKRKAGDGAELVPPTLIGVLELPAPILDPA